MSRIVVLGLGLIGGSLARALDATHEVIGIDADPDTRVLARAAGLTVSDDASAAVAGAELVVVATPLGLVADTVLGLATCDAAATVTDVASLKSPVLAAARTAGLAGRFVGGHPMAGTEHSGFAAADAGLFVGAAWVLILEPDTDLDRWLAVAAVVTALGARVVPATAAEHDVAVARISHLPHLIAAALALTAGGPLAHGLAAGSFRDATRVAAADPALAQAMCALNPTAVDDAVRAFVELVTAPDRDRLIGAGHRARSVWPPTEPAPQEWPDSPGLPLRLLGLGRRGGWVEAVQPDRLIVRDPG